MRAPQDNSGMIHGSVATLAGIIAILVGGGHRVARP